MKKCVKCEYKTSNKDYKICPMCGSKLEIFTGKTNYTIGLSAEDEFHTEIELTYEEAKVVNKVAEKLSKESSGYCGSFWIDFEEVKEDLK